jgi:cytochrome bd ubiquinol oxidase subunit II
VIGDAGILTLALAGVLLAALIAYVLLGGADYGGGVWDLFATGERKERQRALIADAIGPVWEANHVWLILVVVLLFTVFPPAFARLTTVLHLPLLVMLIGIVLRGTAFTFRTYDDQSVYLAFEASAADLQEDFRRMALRAAVAVGALAFLVLLLGRVTPLRITDGLLTRPFAIPLQLLTAAAAITAIGALLRRRYALARGAAVLQVSAILWGWGYVQFPWMVPGVHTVESAAAPAITLRFVAIGLAGGALILVPSLWYLFKVFKSGSASAFERMETAEPTVPE